MTIKDNSDQTVRSAAEKKQLRSFGLLFAAMLAGLFGLLLPLIKSHAVPVWPFVAAAAFAIPALIYPRVLKPFYTLWMKFGVVMGFINTRIILAVFFFVFVTPVGWLMCAFKHDPMRRKFEPESNSYRIASAPQTPADLEKPY